MNYQPRNVPVPMSGGGTDWVWDGANWTCNGTPQPCPPQPPSCPPPSGPPPCPPYFPGPPASVPWYPGANGGVSFGATPPNCPVRGHFWYDGQILWMFDGASWVDVGIAGISSLLNVGAPVFIGSTPPPHPKPGSLWWNGTILQLWDGVAWNLIGPTAATQAKDTALQGAATGLRIQATGTGVTVQARQVIMYDGTAYSTTYNLSATANVGAVGAGGIDQGGLTAAVWYGVWAISNGTLTNLLLSQSSTSPTMPPGYTAKGLLGWVRSTSGGLVSTLQIGRRAQYTSVPLPTITSGAQGSTSPSGQGPVTWAPASVGGVVPPTAAEITMSVGAFGADSALTQVASNGSYGDWATATATPFVSIYATTGGASGPPIYADMMLESGNIYYCGDRSECFCQCMGWVDSL